jgi:hypothetical protein
MLPLIISTLDIDMQEGVNFKLLRSEDEHTINLVRGTQCIVSGIDG